MAQLYASHPYLVDEQVLRHVGFSDHAIKRFAERAGLGTRSRPAVERILRDLLLTEGQVVPERPRWARSSNEAELYLQIGEWMLLICRPSGWPHSGYTAVTAVNGPADNTWEAAESRGYVFTPAPLLQPRVVKARTRWWTSVAIARRARRESSDEPAGIVAAIRATHRARKAGSEAEYLRAIELQQLEARRHEEARLAARSRHLQRYGYEQSLG